MDMSLHLDNAIGSRKSAPPSDSSRGAGLPPKAAAPSPGSAAQSGLSPQSDPEAQLRELEKRGVRACPYRAGRSMAMGQHAMVATSHNYATVAALDMLRKGGNAVDAAIAAAAVLTVVEPMSTGLGGDAFLLLYEGHNRKVRGLNGSGRSPNGLFRDHFTSAHGAEIDPNSWESVTVPGACDAWMTALERFGTRPIDEILAPAIQFAEEGFPVTERVAAVWKDNEELLKPDPWTAMTYLVNGKAPEVGTIFRNPNLAKTLKEVARGGRDAFYRGSIAKEICRHAEESGGFLRVEDFRSHSPIWIEPLTADYRGYEVLQCPPNGQGIGVLMMLNMLAGLNIAKLKHNSPEYVHLLVEIKKLVYADLGRFVADPDRGYTPVKSMLNKAYAQQRLQEVNPSKAANLVQPGEMMGKDTIYLTVVDRQGNAVSFINSIFQAFGSKIVGGDTGILLQNRGSGFTLERGHPNEYAPAKRPYHTILPGMVLRDGKLYLSYGVMGGTMQPQGHLQFLLNHLDFGMSIQEALDCPRWRHNEGLEVLLEHGFPKSAFEVLEKLGHQPKPAPGGDFGGGQAIRVDPETGVLFGASDPRKDGCALGF